MKQPNILLIMTDQLRGDCLGYAGHPDVKTPYLDSLAAKGVSFDRAYSACPSCIAARAALHTGMEQSHHGFAMIKIIAILALIATAIWPVRGCTRKNIIQPTG